MTDKCYEPRPVARRAAMTYELLLDAAYGYAMAALVALGPASSTEVAAYLAERNTPYGGYGNGGEQPPGGSLGVGWYPMSTARLLTQIRLHGYPVKRDQETGQWRMGTGGSREVRDAIAECYRLCAVDPRPPMLSRSY